MGELLMQTITGFLSFPEGLLCKRDALGRIYEGKVANIDVKICFPCEPLTVADDPMKNVIDYNPLIAPHEFKGWKNGDKTIKWGYPVSFPAWNACVECVLIKVFSENQSLDDVGQILYQTIHKWKRAFLEYCTLCTKQNIKRDEGLREREYCLELYATRYISDQTPSVIHVNLPGSLDFASYTQIEEAVKFASSGKELLLEYQMLLSAYNARKKCQNRQAIVDACAAVEICLVNRIEMYCTGKIIDSELFLKKYRSLGDRFNLVAKIDIQFPVMDYNDVIVKPRNDIAHNRNVYPSDCITDSLIMAVEKCLKYYHTTYY